MTGGGAAAEQRGTDGEALRSMGISDGIHYKWRAERGGLRIDQAKRLKELGQEISRLRNVGWGFRMTK